MTEARPPLPEDPPASNPSGIRTAAADAPPTDEDIVATAAAAAPKPRRILMLRNYAWLAGAAVVVFFGLRYLGPILTPFLIGAILAYLGTPIVDWAASKGFSRATSTTVVVLLFALLVALLFLVLIPLVQSEVLLAARRFPEW